jgi:2-iminobutanoate/2-iminopropanoate deaminase
VAAKHLEYFVNPEGVGAPIGAYSHAVTMRGGAATFVSGQVAVDIDGNLEGEGDLGRQTEVVFENLERVLSAAGSSLGDVVKFTTFLTRAEDIPLFYETRARLFDTYFPEHVYPANTLLVVQRLVRPEFLIEIEATAVVDVPQVQASGSGGRGRQ